jgi:hypothetical protein
MLAKTCFLIALITLATDSSPGWAKDSICSKANAQPYHPPGYEFQTTSDIDTRVVVPPPYVAAVRSCVHNTGKSGYFVNWIIPRAKSWANPDDWAVGDAIFVETTKLRPLDGCLFYGNLNEHDAYRFFGTDADKPRVDDETKRGCRAVVFEPYPPSPPIWQKIVNFAYETIKQFPSRVSEPVTTMLELRGTVGVEQTGANSYRSFFRYKVSRYGDSKGDPSQVSVRPMFNGPAERLIKDLLSKYPDGIKLAPEGVIEFDVRDVSKPQLQYVWYDLYLPGSEQPVAGISLPLLVPAR